MDHIHRYACVTDHAQQCCRCLLTSVVLQNKEADELSKLSKDPAKALEEMRKMRAKLESMQKAISTQKQAHDNLFKSTKEELKVRQSSLWLCSHMAHLAEADVLFGCRKILVNISSSPSGRIWTVLKKGQASIRSTWHSMSFHMTNLLG